MDAVVLPWWACAHRLPVIAAADGCGAVTAHRLARLRFRILLPVSVLLAATAGSVEATALWLALLLVEAWAHHVEQLDEQRRAQQCRAGARIPAQRRPAARRSRPAVRIAA